MPEKREAQDREVMAQVAKHEPNKVWATRVWWLFILLLQLCPNSLVVKYNKIPISLATGSHLWFKYMGREASSCSFTGCWMWGGPFLPLWPHLVPHKPPSQDHYIIPVGTTYPDISMDSVPVVVHSSSPVLSHHSSHSGYFFPPAHQDLFISGPLSLLLPLLEHSSRNRQQHQSWWLISVTAQTLSASTYT